MGFHARAAIAPISLALAMLVASEASAASEPIFAHHARVGHARPAVQALSPTRASSAAPGFLPERTAPPARTTVADGTWSLEPPVTPRYGQQVVLDSDRNFLVVFGGWGVPGDALQDVWILNLTGPPAWGHVHPSGTPPSNRYFASAIYDPLRDRMIVFGGIDEGDNPLNDVWALSLAGTASWTQLSPSGTPPVARADHSAIYDPVADRMIVFGGKALSGPLNDVWAMSLGASPAWTQYAPTGTPPAARYVHRSIYDPVRRRMIVFGGSGASSDLNDVWSLSLAGTPSWSALAAGGTPPAARDAHGMIYDPVRDRLVMFGGENYDSSVFFNDSWSLSLSGSPTWSQLAPTGTAPATRADHGVIYDPVNDRMVMFAGGGAYLAFDDTWTLALTGGTAWALLDPGAPARFSASAIHDPVRRRLVVFGGTGSTDGVTLTTYNEVWVRPLSGNPGWTKLTPTGPLPGAREEAPAIYDPVRDRMIVFGGYYGTSALSDVWALSFSGTPAWTQLLPTGTPGIRDSHSAIYDPVRDRMIVFGGTDETINFNSVWALSLGASPAWTQLAYSGTPPSARWAHAAIYDPVLDRMIVFGGRAGSTEYNDTWALSLAGTPAWSQLSPGGTAPAGRDDHTMIYDPVRKRAVIFGGFDGSATLDDAWALSLSGPPAFTQLLPAGQTPLPRGYQNAVYDPALDRMLVYGGADSVAHNLFNDLWALSWSTTVDVPPSGVGSVIALEPAHPNPARGEISIEFALPCAGEASVRVFDVSGRLVKTLHRGPLPAGSHSLTWDGRTSAGVFAKAGLYFYELRMGEQRLARRVVLVR
jgi:hypothetical protein